MICERGSYIETEWIATCSLVALAVDRSSAAIPMLIPSGEICTLAIPCGTFGV